MSNKPEGGILFEEALKDCPLCRSVSIKKLFTIKKYDPSFDIYTCSSCSFIFMNPRFTASALKQLYCEGYYTGNSSYSYIDERKIADFSSHVWRKRLEVIKKYSKDGNFLDVGASFGGFLNAARESFSPYAIEVSDYAGEQLKKIPGLTSHIGTLHDHPFPGNYFSVITMIELIEHLPDPATALKECFRLLSDEGLLVIQTANMAGMQAKFFKDGYAYYMPGHLSYFTENNLTGLLRKTGFRKIKVYHPVEFGLLPKLLKSRHDFKNIRDYRKWLRIALYHLLGKISAGQFSLTSSMVIYAVK